MDRLAYGLAAATISDPADQGAAAAGGGPSADYLLSIMRSVEGADATIRSQVTRFVPSPPSLSLRPRPSELRRVSPLARGCFASFLLSQQLCAKCVNMYRLVLNFCVFLFRFRWKRITASRRSCCEKHNS